MTYSRFVQGHILVHVFLSVQRVDLMVYIIYLLLVSATLPGVDRRGGSSSIFCPAKNDTVGFPTIVIYFYNMYLNTLNIWFHWLPRHVRYGNLFEVSALIMRVLFSLDVSEFFGGVSEVVRNFSWTLPRDLASLLRLISSRISALVSRS